MTAAAHAGQLATIATCVGVVAVILIYAVLCEILVQIERSEWEDECALEQERREGRDRETIAVLARTPDGLDEIEQWVG